MSAKDIELTQFRQRVRKPICNSSRPQMSAWGQNSPLMACHPDRTSASPGLRSGDSAAECRAAAPQNQARVRNRPTSAVPATTQTAKRQRPAPPNARCGFRPWRRGCGEFEVAGCFELLGSRCLERLRSIRYFVPRGAICSTTINNARLCYCYFERLGNRRNRKNRRGRKSKYHHF